MAGRVTTFDLTSVIATFGPIVLTGFADGDVIAVEFDAEQEAVVVGADGDVVRIPSASKLATATVRLQRGSPSAALLRQWKESFIPPLDQAPFVIKDPGNLVVHLSNVAWISHVPPPVFSAEAPVEEWRFRMAKFESSTLAAIA